MKCVLYSNSLSSSKEAKNLEEIFNIELGITAKVSFTKKKLVFYYSKRYWDEDKIENFLSKIKIQCSKNPIIEKRRISKFEGALLILFFSSIPNIGILVYHLVSAVLFPFLIVSCILSLIQLCFIIYFVIRLAISSVRNNALGDYVLFVIAIIGLFALSTINLFETKDISKITTYYSHISIASIFFFAAKSIEYGVVKYSEDINSATKIFDIGYANVLKQDKQLEKIKLDSIKQGDKIVVKKGEIVPVNSMLISKSSYFNQSVVTGDYRPVHHFENERILAGYILLSDEAILEVESILEDSHLEKLRKLMQYRKRKVGNFVQMDKAIAIANIFIIFAFLAIAGIMLACQVRIIEVLATLFILFLGVTPISLIIAMPMPLMIGGSIANYQGITASYKEAILDAASIKNIIYTHVGVLTNGSPIITMFDVPKNYWDIIYTIEIDSTYYIARKVIEYLDGYGAKVNKKIRLEKLDEGRTLASDGVNKYYLGSYRFIKKYLEGEQLDLATEFNEEQIHLNNNPLFFIHNDKLVGRISISDEIRSSARSSIILSKQLGLNIYLFSSQSEQQAIEAAKFLGIKESNLTSDYSSVDRLALLEQIEKTGKSIFVGDSVSDAPMNIRSYLSVCLKIPNRLFAPTTSLTITNEDVTLVPRYIKYARKVRRTIWINIILSILFMLTVIPLVILHIVDINVLLLLILIVSLIIVYNSFHLRATRI